MRLIDADELITAFPCGETVRTESVRATIKHMPTIEERKTGEWLSDNNNYFEERFICSVCGKSYKVDTCMGKPMWDFCPCGADMREQP